MTTDEILIKNGYKKMSETIYNKTIKAKHIEPIMTIDEAKQILQDNLLDIQRDTSLSIRLAIEIVLKELERKGEVEDVCNRS